MEIVLTLAVTIVLAFFGKNYFSEKTERRKLERELSRLANEVVAETLAVDGASERLKLAYQASFAKSGQGEGSGRLEVYTRQIERDQRAIGPMQRRARDLLDDRLSRVDDDEAEEFIREFEGNLAHLSRMKETLAEQSRALESRVQN